MEHVKVRKAVNNDIPAILELLYELQRPRPKTKFEKTKFKKQILRYLSDENKGILISEIDSQIVGFVTMMFLPRLNRTKKEMYIPELVVAKDYRRLGIGKLLIMSSIDIGKRKNCFRMRLESGNQRKEAHRFYQNLGFEQSALSYSFDLTGK